MRCDLQIVSSVHAATNEEPAVPRQRGLTSASLSQRLVHCVHGSPSMKNANIKSLHVLTAAIFLVSGSLVLFELLLTRIFAVVLFDQLSHLALVLALLGIGVGAVVQYVWPQILPDEGLERRLAWVCLGHDQTPVPTCQPTFVM